MKIMVLPAESTTFTAGGEIYGRMDLNCKGDGGGSKGKSELLVGEIGIELIAYDGRLPFPAPQKMVRIANGRISFGFRGISSSIPYLFTFSTDFSNSF
jgi:hypothetical protein